MAICVGYRNAFVVEVNISLIDPSRCAAYFARPGLLRDARRRAPTSVLKTSSNA
jgi:hypothetical protein